MRCGSIVVVLGFFTGGAMLGQQPTFEVASVKLVNPASHPTFAHRGGPGTADPSRIHWCCNVMLTLLTRAYAVESDRVVGPAWISDFAGSNLYEIDATLSPHTTVAEFLLMQQNLLAERFHLKLHHEMRIFPGYELVVAKHGTTLKPVASNLTGTAGDHPTMKSMVGLGMMRIESVAEGISNLIPTLGRVITESMGTDPADLAVPRARVSDKTGLTGKYSYVLEFACDGCRGSELPTISHPSVPDKPPGGDSGSSQPSIFRAIEEQLGLKLEKTKGIPLDVIVVDSVDKIPAVN